MLLSPTTAAAIREGAVTLAFRRWDVPRVQPGGTQRTSAGVMRFGAVQPISDHELTEDDAKPACRIRTVATRAGVPGSD